MKSAKWRMGLSALLGIVACVALPAAYGATATVDGIKWTYTVSNGKATVGGGSGDTTAVPTNTSGAIVIPSKLGGYPVTGIAGSAFRLCCGLKSVTIPASVTSIEEMAFSAFGDCGLTNISVVTGNSTYTSKDGVLFDKGMKTIVQYPGGRRGTYAIPDGVTKIGNYAFYCCQRMWSVTIPSSVTNIGIAAFNDCTSLDSITIPSRVTSIEDWAFMFCGGLQSVTIPDSVTNIGRYAFSCCSGLTNVTIGNGVKSIGEYAFDFCYRMTSLKIGNSVKSIGNYAFTRCEGLTSLTIPASVTKLGSGAFSGCSGLQTLHVPASWVGTSMLSTASLPAGCEVVYAAVQLALSSSSRTFTADVANSKELSVTANVSWTAKSSASWLTVKTARGSGNGKVVYNVAANTGTSSRTTIITVAGGGISRIFTVTQSGKSGGGGTTATLSLKASSRSFTADAASSKEMSVTANVSWTAKSSASWLAVKTAKGSGSGKIVYSVAANTGAASRTAIITVAGGGISRTFTVTQSGKSGESGTTAILSLKSSSRSFTAAAASGKEMSVTANVSWTAKSSASWLAVKTASGSGNGKIVYNVAANTGTGSRTATITVAGGGLTRMFTATQEGKSGGGTSATLTLSSSSRTFTADAANSKELGVTANVSWTAKSSASWLVLKTAKGSGNGKLVYNVAANTGTASRTAVITVAGGGISRTFTVTQSGKSGGGVVATLTLGASSRSFTAGAASSKELSVTANVSWTAKSSASWLVLKTASGKGNGTIVYNVAANTGTARTGTITVSGGGASRTFTVTQGGITAVKWTYTVSNGKATVGSYNNTAVPTDTSGAIVIPSKLGGYPVTSIGEFAFSHCGGLTSVTIPSSVTNIGWRAFICCSNLTSMTIPASVKSLGEGVFIECTSLKAVTVETGNPAYVSKNGVVFTKDGKTLLRYPGGKTGSYSIPSGVKNIGKCALRACPGLTSVTIPNSVTNIGYGAFVASGLKNVTIPNSVKSIEEFAFMGCDSLTSVTIPSSVTTIGHGAFSACSGLNTLYVPTSWRGTSMLSNASVPEGCEVVYGARQLVLGASSRTLTADVSSRKELGVTTHVSWTAKSSAPAAGAVVTTSDGSDGSAVADGDEGTGWCPTGTAGAWVALTFDETRTVDAVVVVGDSLPAGMRVLVSEDADTWSEEGGEEVQYLWLLLPGEGEVPTVREIATEP